MSWSGGSRQSPSRVRARPGGHSSVGADQQWRRSDLDRALKARQRSLKVSPAGLTDHTISMAFFRSVNFSEQTLPIAGTDVVLRPPQMSDYLEWAALREASRNFLTPWEPTWPADDLTRASFRRRIRRYFEDQRGDLAYPCFIFRKSDNVLVGGITLANVRRGCAQACSLGYWMGHTHARRGYMTAAVRAVVPFAFETLRLHRIEAACIPANL